jgi:hypothetical protein
VYVYDDDGKQLDAKYEVERDGDGLALILGSAGGASNARLGTTAAYKDALLVLLQRLKTLQAVLDDALVDTQNTRRQGIPEDARRIIDPPVELTTADVVQLRKELLSRQSRVARSPDAKRKDGNNTRSIRLRLTVPVFGPGDAKALADVIAQRVYRPLVIGQEDEQLPVGPLPPSVFRFPHDDDERSARADSDAASVSDTPISDEDARKRTLRQIAARQGQSGFRTKLIIAYDGRCAVTGCDVPYVLEAAHLHPYRGPHTNVVTNGLLLRADIHTLLDYKLWAPDPSTRAITTSKSLNNTPYGELSGQLISEPISPASRPSDSALDRVWREFCKAEEAR